MDSNIQMALDTIEGAWFEVRSIKEDSREKSMVLTKLDEAFMWMEKVKSKALLADKESEEDA